MRDRPALRNEIINNNDRARARCGSRSFNWLLDFNRTLAHCAAHRAREQVRVQDSPGRDFFSGCVGGAANPLFKSDFPP